MSGAQLAYHFFLSLLLAPAALQAAVHLPPQAPAAVDLAGHLERLPGFVSGLDIETVASGRAGAFQRLPGQLIAGIGGPREVWLRFTLAPDSRGWLRVMPAVLDHVDLYWRENGIWQHRRGGEALASDEHPAADRASVFPVYAARESPRRYYVHLQQDGLLNAYLVLFSQEALHRMQVTEGLVFGLYFGAFFSLILINLLHWVTLRETLFAELALYLMVRAGFFLAFNGLLLQYLIPGQPGLNQALLQSLLAGTVVSHVLLISRVLDMPRHYPALAWLFRGLAALAALIALSVWFGAFTQWLRLLLLSLMAANVLGLLVAVAGVRRKRRAAWILLLAMTFVALGQGATSLAALGTHLSMWTDLYAAQLGSLVVALAFHFAVAKRAVELKEARNESEAMARQAARRAERERQARQEQSDWIAMLYHEIKTPLAEIASAATVLEHLDDGRRPDTSQRYDNIQAATERLNWLVEQGLARERQGLEEVHLQRQRLSLEDIATQMVAEQRGDTDHAFVVAGPPAPLPPLSADPDLLRVALANLLDNAVKYSPPGEAIRIQIEASSGYQILTVSDQGPGLTPSAAARAFDRFWRGDAQGDVPGAGLGLYLVRKIVQAHQGDICIATAPGRGSRFRLALPEEPS